MVMQFETQAGGIIQFSEEVSNVLHSFRQLDSERNESGGILLGRLLKNETDFIVDFVTSPTRYDKANRFSFFRPLRLAQQIVENAWHRSRGTQNYFGEWHTHPEDEPSPSSIDINNWQRIWRRSTVSTKELFFVIVGRRTTKVWSLNNGNKIPMELMRMPADTETFAKISEQ